MIIICMVFWILGRFLLSEGSIAFTFVMGSIIGQRMVLRLKDSKRDAQHSEEISISRWMQGIDLSDGPSAPPCGDLQTVINPVQSN